MTANHLDLQVASEKAPCDDEEREEACNEQRAKVNKLREHGTVCNPVIPRQRRRSLLLFVVA